jgi:putative spermidine/putrescine transport system permease protein
MSQVSLPDHAGPVEKIWHWLFIAICAFVFLFLIAPILVIIPLSFNAEPYFTFTPEMLSLDPDAFSFRWYEDFASKEIWQRSIQNSFIIAFASTLLATTLGTLAALGLSRSEMPFKGIFMGLLISPMIVPIVITAAGIFFFYATISDYIPLTGTYLGIILAHTVLGTPFVVITVTATLSGFDHSLTRAGAMMGANPTTVFFKIIMPLILPGVISGALFAFVTSFDEVVVVLFVASVEQQTIPRQMWAGIRESISPTILAVATILICISIMLLATVEILRRRSERLRGLSAG